MCSAVLIVVAWMCPVPASAQVSQLPPCPNTDDLVTTYVPEYMRIGDALAFTIERENARAVQQVRVILPTADGPQEELVTFPSDRLRVRLIRFVPPKARSLGLSFSWDQNVGKNQRL